MPAIWDHVELIIEAKKRNFNVIACDNNMDNIGHKFSDSSANISLLDIQAIYQYAKENKVDVITAYSTDIGAKPAAYISEQLNLIGSGCNAVDIMCNKSKFRAFLKENNFYCPAFQTISNPECYDNLEMKFPLIVKPTDRAGSKGVFVAKDNQELSTCIKNAHQFSLEGNVIVEEFIETQINQIHGDAIIQNGELLFCFLGDQYFGSKNQKYSPIATIFPSKISSRVYENILSELKRFILLAGYKNGGINLEVRISINEQIFFVELGPRYGGNLIPKAISYSYGINLVKCAMDIIEGKIIERIKPNVQRKVIQFILRSNRNGFFQNVSFLGLEGVNLLYSHLLINKGEWLSCSGGTGDIICIYIYEFDKEDTARELMSNPYQYFEINIA